MTLNAELSEGSSANLHRSTNFVSLGIDLWTTEFHKCWNTCVTNINSDIGLLNNMIRIIDNKTRLGMLSRAKEVMLRYPLTLSDQWLFNKHFKVVPYVGGLSDFTDYESALYEALNEMGVQEYWAIPTTKKSGESYQINNERSVIYQFLDAEYIWDYLFFDDSMSFCILAAHDGIMLIAGTELFINQLFNRPVPAIIREARQFVQALKDNCFRSYVLELCQWCEIVSSANGNT